MKSSRWLWLAVTCAATACNLYNEQLLEDAVGDDGPSGGAPTGGNDSGGGADSGGAQSGGGTSGGTGGEGNGGSGGEGGEGVGGGETGGTGGGDGGTTGGGGTGGGDGGSGGGSGGTPIVYIGLVDDFSDTTAGYSNMPFYGDWARYEQSGGVWTATNVAGMMQDRPDDDTNGALHVDATMLDDWGVGTFVTLRKGGAVDLTDATGIRFNAISMNTETVLKVAIADIHSHRNNCLTVDDGADCDRHMKTVTSFALSDEWAEVELPLTDFVDKVIDGVNDRSSDLDLTQVFALHFQMDPDDEVADFYLDDLEVY